MQGKELEEQSHRCRKETSFGIVKGETAAKDTISRFEDGGLLVICRAKAGSVAVGEVTAAWILTLICRTLSCH